MDPTTSKLAAGIFIVVVLMNVLSAAVANADYITVYPGSSGKLGITVENNDNFDIIDASVTLNLAGLPFTAIGSSTKDYGDINEDDDQSETFTIQASTDITPGDYSIPYTIKYTSDLGNSSQVYQKNGSFAIRVSAKTELDFAAETQGNAIVGQKGQVTLEIINKGLGEIKSVSVQIFPQGFDLTSTNKVFIGTINPDDSDTASFNVVYQSQSPVLTAKISYKDFDNNDQTKTVSLPIQVYTQQEAYSLGILSRPNYTIYFIIGILVLAYIVYRVLKKRKKRK